MAYPTAIVEIAFTDSPYAVTPTWTDVTPYVRSMTVDRGRSDDWSPFNGYASVTFNNRDRRFDPFNTSSPYSPNLQPRKQIRIRATAGATTYDVFRGFVAGFPPNWTDAGQDSTVTVSCFDAMGLLAQETLPADWSIKYITSTSPLHYWRMDEPIQPFLAGQTLKDYGSYPRDMTTTAVASSGQQLAVGLVNSSLQGTGDIAAQTGTGNVAAVTPFSVSMWAILDPDNNNIYGETSDCFWGITFDAANSKYVVIIQKNATALQYRYDTVDKYDGAQPRMLSFIFNPGVFFGLYIDGVLVATTATTSATVYIPTGDKTFIEGAQVQQLVIWNSAVTAGTFQEIYKYSTVAFAETTSARFNRIIGETSFPAGSFPAGLTSVPASPAASVLDITDNAPTVAGELQKVADSEYAPLFVTRDGVLTMYQQNQIRTQTRSIVSQATFGAGGYPLGQDIQLRLDGDSMRNVANVTMSQGGVYIQKNTGSVSTYGAAEASVDTEVLALSNAVQIGNIVTGWGGQVYAAAEPFEVMLSPTASWGFALDRELNDRITLAVAPPTGATITIPMLLSRIAHTVTAGQWQTTFEGSARWAAVFIVGKSLIGGTDLLG